MRLVRCHIDNFGKFSDYEVDFTENPCVFQEPNGWGKSTLAAFIKVMFYGFANEKKRGDALERERVRYKPWQGGSYGGELEFEAGGKRYLLNRTFGAKESADTFLLYDAATNLISGDFTANIGEELFQINQESFLRTVYIAQNDCYTAATDSISAKIGNLSECLDDMGNYEKAQQAIKDLWNSLTPTKKTGTRSLKRQKEEIAELREELRRAEAVEQSVSDLEAKLEECLAKREERIAERRATQHAWETAAAQKAVEARRTHYESILRQYEEKRRGVEEALASLGGNVPDHEMLQRMQGVRDQMMKQESEAAACALEESEREKLSRLRGRFREGVPDEETLRRGEKLLDSLEEWNARSVEHRLSGEERLEYNMLRSRFTGQEDCTEEQSAELLGRLEEGAARLNLYIEKESGLGTKKAALCSMRMLEQSVEERRGRRHRAGLEEKGLRRGAVGAVSAVLALICLTVGAVFLGLGKVPAGIVPLGVGVILTMAAIAFGLRRGRTSGQEKSPGQDGGEAGEGTAALEREIARDESQMREAKRYAADCLNAFGMELSDFGGDARQARDALYGLRHDWQRLQRLRARETDYLQKDYEGRMRDAREELLEILRPYCAESRLREEKPAELYAELCRDGQQLAELEARSAKWENAREKAAARRAELADFLREYGQGEGRDPDVGLRKISQSLTAYEKERQESDRLKKERQDFEAAYDIGMLKEPVGPVADPQEELRARMEELDEQTAALWEQARAYQGQLDERQQELEELADVRERLSGLEAAYDKDYAYFTNLGITGEYLKKARESLSARYIGPMYESFRRGYELIAGESGEDFRMDARLHVSRRAMGELRETKAFSLGSQDLIHIVLRVALVDAMYEGECPFLILDDSFVNLDEERMEAAWGFLQDIAKRYQVIYFTCHGSRADLGNRGGLERRSV